MCLCSCLYALCKVHMNAGPIRIQFTCSHIVRIAIQVPTNSTILTPHMMISVATKECIKHSTLHLFKVLFSNLNILLIQFFSTIPQWISEQLFVRMSGKWHFAIEVWMVKTANDVILANFFVHVLVPSPITCWTHAPTLLNVIGCWSQETCGLKHLRLDMDTSLV